MTDRPDDETAHAKDPSPGDDAAAIAHAIARGQHHDALGRVARLYGAAVGKLAMAFTGDPLRAGELTIVTFLEAYDAFPAYREEDDLETWLFGIARRVCARHADGAPGGPDQQPKPPFAALRPTERDAALLRYLGGFSFQTVGAVCGTDDATARKRAGRALLALARAERGAASDAASGVACREVEDDLAGVVDGTATRELFDHVGACDACRDLRHDAGIAKTKLAHAGDRYLPPPDLDAKLLAAINARPAPAAAPAQVPAPTPAAAPVPVKDVPRGTDDKPLQKSLPSVRISYVTLGGLLALALVLWAGKSWLAGRFAKADRPFTGHIESFVRASSDTSGGLLRCLPSGPCEPAGAGQDVPAGTRLRTDARTRAHVVLADGTLVVMDRDTELELVLSRNRTARLVRGALVVDVAATKDGPDARFLLPRGYVETLGTKFSLTVAEDRADVEVVRGAVRLVDDDERGVIVRAGEEGRIFGKNAPLTSPAVALADAIDWSDESDKSDEDTALRGLGELRAKKPGEATERERGVRLASHAVKVRIVDNVARTEVDETFANDAADTLEGIFRFPLPPDAQIERLALEVNGQWEEGAFVERDKAAAIFRGVLQHAAPNLPKPEEEIIWVPGPWRDPALLEWKHGGRFELKIFPIPAHGSRRIALAYTQTLPPAGSVRRYTYPLPYDPHGSTAVDDFRFDVKITGHDKNFGVKARGYALTPESGSGDAGEKLSFTEARFVPAGDLSFEYVLPERDAEVTAWAYEPSPSDGAENGCSGGGGDAFVAFALRPRLPHWSEERERDHVIVVDASRSMYGERFARASALATATVREMDRRDRLYVLACDTTCRSMSTEPTAPGTAASDQVARFLAGIVPEGGSDLVAAVRAAKNVVTNGAARGPAGNDKQKKPRDTRIVYIGDGSPSVGPIKPDHIRAEVARVVPANGSVTGVAIGTDADVLSLEALAAGGGGVVVPYVPGRRTSSTALAVLSATYGIALRDPEVQLPAGFTEVVPRKLDALSAGSETLVFARMAKGGGEQGAKDVTEGTIKLKGKVGGEAYEQAFPIRVVRTTSAANAFVPRLYAASRIADLERTQGDGAKSEIVNLSKACRVASRYTSMLVLESEAMYRAYGLGDHRSTSAPLWTGEEGASSTSASGELDVAGVDPEEPLADKGKSEDRGVEKKVDAPAGNPWGEPSRRTAGASAMDEIGSSGAGRGGFATGATAPSPAKPAAKAAAPMMNEAESRSAPPAAAAAPEPFAGAPAPATQMAAPPPPRDMPRWREQPLELQPPPPPPPRRLRRGECA